VALGGWNALAPSTEPTWSLAVEEQFYLVWPAVVYLCSARRLKVVCLACLAAAPLIRLLLALSPYEAAAYVLTPARMDGLALGALIALWSREPGAMGRLLAFARPVALVAGVAIAGVFLGTGGFGPEEPIAQVVGLTASTYLMGAVLVLSVSAREGSRWYRTLASRPLRAVGQYAYAIYLLHYPLAYTLDKLHVVRWASFENTFGPTLQAQIAYTATMVVLATIAGALSWHLYEKQFLKLRRFFPYAYEETRRSTRAAHAS
jgi:peptidoglycan/LPS O-acetylase OafA/YrhL